MAAGGFRTFVAGEILTEDLINDYLLQGMLVFAGTAARGSAITAPVEGQFSYLADSNSVQFYSGTQWTAFAGQSAPAVVSGTTGSPTLGTVVSGADTFLTYSYTGDGSIIFSDAGLVDVLVVGAGGGGGTTEIADTAPGGAGGGQPVQISNFFVSAGTAVVTRGVGGATNLPGGGSSFDTLRVSGGGAGGSGGQGGSSAQGRSGASGGGGGSNQASNAGSGGSPVVNANGNAGGVGTASATLNQRAGGGGGGAGAVGGASSAGVGGNGGAGTAFTITGASVTYCGGGGGGTRSGSSQGTGGAGGGGAAGVAGTPNTGGGGGAVAAGGSGIVIVSVKI